MRALTHSGMSSDFVSVLEAAALISEPGTPQDVSSRLLAIVKLTYRASLQCELNLWPGKKQAKMR